MTTEKFLKSVEWSIKNDEACSRVPDEQKVKLDKIVRIYEEALQRIADGDVGQGGHDPVYSKFAKRALEAAGKVAGE